MISYQPTKTSPPVDVGEDIDADTLLRVQELIEVAEHAPLDRQAELRAHINNTILLGSPSRMAMKLSNNRWLPYRHLVLLNRYLNDLANRRILRLLVTMPPRHGKSWTCSRYFPAYYFAKYPEHRIILTSYEGRFAARWGGMVRDTITKNRELLGLEISSSSKSKAEWDFVGSEGGMMTAGIGGPVTGKGAHLLVIDDPVKNADEAASTEYQERNFEWYQSTAHSRLEPDNSSGSYLPGVVLLIQTRWHEADLAGKIIAEQGDQWTVLNLPALSEGDEEGNGDPLHRPTDAPLCPERFPRDELEKIRLTSGGVTWSALYQQRPSPKGGLLFKKVHFRYFDYLHADQAYYTLRDETLGPDGAPAITEHFIAADKCWKFQTVDLAAKKRTQNDWSVVSTWAVTPPTDELSSKLLLLAVDRLRVDPTQHLPLMTRNHTIWRPTFQSVDENTFGIGLIESGRRAGLRIKPIDATGDKYSNALLAGALLVAHHVYFDRAADWYPEWEAELLSFPNGEFDDQVDTFSFAAIEFDRMSMGRLNAVKHKTQSIRQQILNRSKKKRNHPVLGRI